MDFEIKENNEYKIKEKVKELERDPTAKFYRELRREVIDNESGEILSGITEKVGIIPKEPDFVKLYLADLAYLSHMPKWATGILYELLLRMNYKNEIILNAGVKRVIEKEMQSKGHKITVKSISNALTNFVTNKILIREDTGVYRANPWLFGKGEWKDIRHIRLSIGYNLEGVREFKADIERENQEI